MKKISFALLSFFLFSCADQTKEASTTTNDADSSKTSFDAAGRNVSVYTTADTANYRLSLTNNNLQFAQFGQPKETQICVFVDPDKTYQSFFGIGAALTDASAETFAKLPKAKQ